MKSISEAYSHPVITYYCGNSVTDYTNSKFNADLKLELDNEKGEVVINYNIELTNSTIDELIKNGEATFVLKVESAETYFSEIFRFRNNSGSIRLNSSLFNGKVDIEPSIVALSNIKNFRSSDFNEDYEDRAFNIPVGSQIGLGKTKSTFIELEPLDLRSLVIAKESSSLDPLNVRYDFENNFIYVLMGSEFFKLWNVAKSQDQVRPYIFYAIFKDCLYFALEHYRQSLAEEHQGVDWVKSLQKELSKRGISITKDTLTEDLHDYAQSLVTPITIKKIKLES